MNLFKIAAMTLGARVKGGRLTVVDGEERACLGSLGGFADPLEATIEVNDPRFYAALAKGGSIGLGQSFSRGWFSCDDLVSFLRILTRQLPSIESLGGLANRVGGPVLDSARKLRRQDQEKDRENIHAHYDLGNEFFSLFLDETMSYSCGYFEAGESTLARASVAKIERLCRKLALGPDDHLVEIGTGWGGFAIHAASRYGCRVTTTTISDRQYEFASQLVKSAGLEDQVTVLDKDYRDLEGEFDKLVSVEMIEAVDWREHDRFFASCSRLLKRDGLMAIQAIVIADQFFERAKNRDDFIKRFIFPGSCIPSIDAISHSAARSTDMRIFSLEDIGAHYVRTLALWREALLAKGDELDLMGYGASFARLWEFYFSYCEAGFAERHISDVQIVLAKPAWRSSPQVSYG